MMTNKHGKFRCACPKCRAAYFAWGDSPIPAGMEYDRRKWDSYNDPFIKDAARERGYISHFDLMACGHSLICTWESSRKALQLAGTIA